MTVKMYVLKDSWSMAKVILEESPKLEKMLDDRGIALRPVEWDGNSLPIRERGIILATVGYVQQFGEKWMLVVQVCDYFGHLIFIGNDKTISPLGVVQDIDIQRTERFLGKLRSVHEQ